MAKIYPGEYTILDVAGVAANPMFRTAVTPFGITGRINRYVGKSAPWKGVVGIEAVKSINPAVAAGLARAISMSKAHREKGVVEIMTPHGPKVMPAKAAAMARAGKNAAGYGSPRAVTPMMYYRGRIPLP